MGVFSKYLPNIPMDRAAADGAVTGSLSQIFGVLPSANDEFKAEILAALEQS